MLNIDDCELFDMNDPRQISGTVNNDDFYYDHDSDDDDFESRRHCEHSFNDDEDEVEEEEDDDDDDEDDTEATKRRNNLLRTQLIMEAASDDNANVHSFDNMKFTNFELSPWNTQPTAFDGQSNDFGATNFFPDEVNFQTNFPSSSVTAIFDPIDPFASFNENPTQKKISYTFDAAAASFGDFDAVFGNTDANSSSTTTNDEVAFEAVFPTTTDMPVADTKSNDTFDVKETVVNSVVVQESPESQQTANGTLEPTEIAKL